MNISCIVFYIPLHFDESLHHGGRVGEPGQLGGHDVVLNGGAGSAHAIGGGLSHQLEQRQYVGLILDS